MLALLTEPDEEATNVTIFASVWLPRLEVAGQKCKASYGVLSGKHSQHETDAKLSHHLCPGRSDRQAAPAANSSLQEASQGAKRPLPSKLLLVSP